MIRFLIPLFVCLLAMNAHSQNAKEDILKINEAYAKFNDLSMTINYTLYPNFAATAPVETETGSFKQHGDLRYSRLKGIESLQNKDYLIAVDNEDKVIVVSNPGKFNPGKITLVDLDKAFTNCSSIQFIDNKTTQNGYKLSFKQNIVSEFDAIDLYFNKKSFLVEKIVFYYREKIRVNQNDETAPKEKPKLEIVFSNMDFKAMPDITFFSETRFIEKRKGKYYPVSAYSKYEVIDQKIEK